MAPILGLNLCFWGTQFWPPNSIESCFGTATEMAPIGLCGRPIFGATFCEQFGLIITNAEKKEIRPQKLKLFIYNHFYIQTLLHTDAFTHRSFYTQTLSLTNTFLHRDFYTQTLLDTDAFTHRRFTHRNFYTQTLSLTNTFLHRDFYTQTLFTYKSFYTQTLLQMFLHTYVFTDRIVYPQTFLHTNTFTHKHFYTQRLLHTDAFTHRSFYTQTLLHGRFTHKHFHTQTLLHTETFTHRRFCRQKLSHTDVLHTDAFTHRRFYTQKLLHTDDFTHRRFYTKKLLHTDAFTHRRFYTQKLLHTGAFTHKPLHRRFYTQTRLHTEVFTQTLFLMEPRFVRKGCGTNQIAILPKLRSIESFCAKVLRGRLCNRNFYLSFGIQISFRAKDLRETTRERPKILARQHSRLFQINLAGTSTIVLYSFQSPQASLCPCANVLRRDMASARPRQARPRLQGLENTEPPKERSQNQDKG